MAYGQTDSGTHINNEADTTQEEYLTIVFTGFFINSQSVYISINGEDYERRTAYGKGNFNYNGVIKIMKEFNEKGWVVKNSNMSFKQEDSDYLFILMTRKKNTTQEGSD